MKPPETEDHEHISYIFQATLALSSIIYMVSKRKVISFFFIQKT